MKIQKIIGIVIILIAVAGVITNVNNLRSQLSYAPKFIEQQRTLSTQGQFNVPEANLTMLEKKVYSNIYQGFYISLIILLIYSIPGWYLLIARKNKSLAGNIILLSLAVIDFLATLLIKGSSDAIIASSLLVTSPVSVMYIVTFIVIVVSRNNKKIVTSI